MFHATANSTISKIFMYMIEQIFGWNSEQQVSSDLMTHCLYLIDHYYHHRGTQTKLWIFKINVFMGLNHKSYLGK